MIHIAIKVCCTGGVGIFFSFFFHPEELPKSSDIDENGSLRLVKGG